MFGERAFRIAARKVVELAAPSREQKFTSFTCGNLFYYRLSACRLLSSTAIFSSKLEPTLYLTVLLLVQPLFWRKNFDRFLQSGVCIWVMSTIIGAHSNACKLDIICHTHQFISGFISSLIVRYRHAKVYTDWVLCDYYLRDSYVQRSTHRFPSVRVWVCVWGSVGVSAIILRNPLRWSEVDITWGDFFFWGGVDP